MGVLANLRRSKQSNQEGGLILPDGSSSSSSASSSPKKKWKNFLLAFVFLVVVGEIAFLGRLDLAKNAAPVDWAHSRFYRSAVSVDGSSGGSDGGEEIVDAGAVKECEEWLEKEDYVVYVRDFNKDHILVVGAEKKYSTILFILPHRRRGLVPWDVILAVKAVNNLMLNSAHLIKVQPVCFGQWNQHTTLQRTI